MTIESKDQEVQFNIGDKVVFKKDNLFGPHVGIVISNNELLIDVDGYKKWTNPSNVSHYVQTRTITLDEKAAAKLENILRESMGDEWQNIADKLAEAKQTD